ncbi:MAG: sulfotransferase [Pseudomonadota bacterium]
MSDALENALSYAAALAADGNYPAARRHLAALSNTSQRDANVQQQLGAWFFRMGDHMAAAFCFDRWVRADSQSADALISLGSALQMTGALEQASSSYESALRLAPDRSDAWSNLGTVYQAQADLHRAKDAYERARQIDPGAPDALAGLASVLSLRGDHDAALTLLEDTNPSEEHVEVALLHARLLRRRGDAQPAEDRLRRAAKAPTITRSQRSRLDFALGDALDAQARVDEAFAAYLRANASRGITYDADGHRGFVAFIAYRSSAARNAVAGVREPAPLFIVGMPRSGTTLLEQMLDCHGAVVALGERNVLPNVVAQLAEAGKKYPYPDEPAKLTRDALDAGANQYREGWPAAMDGVRYLTDKLPGNWLYLDMMARLFPNARVINMRRDLSDVGWSLFSNDFAHHSLPFAYSLKDIGEHYVDYHQLMEVWHATPPVPLLDLRYEDLVSEPEKELRRVLDFLGLDFQSNVLDFHDSSRVAMTVSNDQVRQPLYQSSVGRSERYSDYLAPLLDAVRNGGVDAQPR